MRVTGPFDLMRLLSNCEPGFCHCEQSEAISHFVRGALRLLLRSQSRNYSARFHISVNLTPEQLPRNIMQPRISVLLAQSRSTHWPIAVVLSVLLLSACTKPAEPAQASKPALKVSLVQAQQAPISDDISASGTIAAREEVLLGVELTGVRVNAVLVEVGQRVKAGQVLLRLDDRTLQVEQIQVRAQAKQAQASLTVAQANAKRGAELRKRGLTSQADTDQVTAALLNAQAGIELANAALQASELRLSFATLKAPSDGIISARGVQPGTVVSAGAELLRMIKNGALEWRAELSANDFLRVKVGDIVHVDIQNAHVEGAIRAIDAGLQMQSRTGVVYANVPEDAGLRAGTFAQGRIVLGSRSGLVLPATAIVQRDGYSYVFTVTADVVSQKQVQLGATVERSVEVVAGLDAATAVVAEGAGFLTDGDRVQVFAAAPAAKGEAQ